MTMTERVPPLSASATLADQAYEIIRRQILAMELPPGTRLKDSDLTEALGISNTPVREALGRLEQAELVETLPRRGTFVKRLSAREVQGLYEVRETLEILAVRLAADRAGDDVLRQVEDLARLHAEAVQRGDVDEYLGYDRDFHDLIARAADNPVLASMLSSLADRIHIVRRMDLGRRQDLVSGQQHLEVAQALRVHNGEQACRLMEAHIREHKGRVLELLTNQAQEETTDHEP
jgi:DNA-binding GntR family transcriptional regulator